MDNMTPEFEEIYGNRRKTIERLKERNKKFAELTRVEFVFLHQSLYIDYRNAAQDVTLGYLAISHIDHLLVGSNGIGSASSAMASKGSRITGSGSYSTFTRAAASVAAC